VSTYCEMTVLDRAIHLLTNGTCSATTSAGKHMSAKANSICGNDWTLEVEDWSPSHMSEKALNSSYTVKTWLPPVTLTSLRSWLQIHGLSNASGIGVYTAGVVLNPQPNTHIFLSIEEATASKLTTVPLRT
jgi:hypothetical protein